MGRLLAIAAAFSLAAFLTPVAAQTPRPYDVPRTPWGDPDFQGIYSTDDARGIPLQRPEPFGERAQLNDQELLARRQRDDETLAATRAGAGTFVGEVGTRTLRMTSLVIDPRDGRIPAVTPAAKERTSATTNFNGGVAIGGTRHTSGLTLTERLTRVSADTINYEATVNDPATWTRPWTIALPMSTQPGYRVFPFECHEGNQALRNMLSAARAEEQVIEEYTRKGLPPPPLARPGDNQILPPDPSFGRPR